MIVTQLCHNSLQPRGLEPTRLLCSWNSPGKSTGVGCHFPLQGIFPTQGLNLGLLHCRHILYHLSQRGSPSLQWAGAPLLVRCMGVLLRWLPFLLRAASGACRYMHATCELSSWAEQLWALQLSGSREKAQQLWLTGLAAVWYVWSSWIRNQTCVSFIGRRILCHWTARDASDCFHMKSEGWVIARISFQLSAFSHVKLLDKFLLSC